MTKYIHNAVDVVQRKNLENAVGIGIAPGLGERLRHCVEVRMCQNDSLWLSSCATNINN